MATIRKRNGKWQAQVRRTGHAPRSQSFASNADALRWARTIERDLDRSLIPSDTQRLDDITVADLLIRYRATVTIKKRGAPAENLRLGVFLRAGWAALPLSRITSHVFAKHRDQRLREVSQGTVIRELGILRSIFETARREWDIPLLENPLAFVRKPRAADGRTRRLHDGELDALLSECVRRRNDCLHDAILLAIETGTRRGELLNICWQDIDFSSAVLTIPLTKNGVSRRIPLTERAIDILNMRQQRSGGGVHVFPITGNAFRLAWERCRRKVGKNDPGVLKLRFHDLRHEAISRFFEFGLSTAEVALISGHRDMRMLFRYTHLKPESIAAKLRHKAPDQEQAA